MAYLFLFFDKEIFYYRKETRIQEIRAYPGKSPANLPETRQKHQQLKKQEPNCSLVTKYVSKCSMLYTELY